MIPFNSDWVIVRVDGNNETIYLIDLDLGSQSVTNDAEHVVSHLANRWPTWKYVYRDSEKMWCELLHDGTKFTGFGAPQVVDWYP